MSKVAIKTIMLAAAIVASLSFTVIEASAESGIASVYTVRSNGGTRTASGRPFRDGELTAAHRKLPFGTRVRVVSKRTGKSVVVTITDRGPFIRGRVIDLSMAAARVIGLGYSIVPVRLEVIR